MAHLASAIDWRTGLQAVPPPALALSPPLSLNPPLNSTSLLVDYAVSPVSVFEAAEQTLP